MKAQEALSEVNKFFLYNKDKKLFIGDSWRILNNKKYHGDCDDFALTVLWLMCDKKISKFIWNVLVLHKFRLYYSRTFTKEPHIIGYADGLWFDNWTQEALDEEKFFYRTGHRKYFFYPGFAIIWFMLLGVVFG